MKNIIINLIIIGIVLFFGLTINYILMKISNLEKDVKELEDKCK
jgi:hypothetical protein